MFSYSTFQQEQHNVDYVHKEPLSPDYRVYINGEEVPVYTCRISAYPFNTWWPGHQRNLNQTTLVSYVNLVSDEAIELAVEPLTKTAYSRIMLKPYARGVETAVKDGKICFTLKENGGYVLELDDYFGLLYIFNNKPVLCEDPGKVTYYFGPGIHFPGKITLQSNESIYVDKDALVYGCVFAENAENIHIYGNGIFNDSTEERVYEQCYACSTNGNLKFYDCKQLRIEGLGFTNSAVWCVNIFHCNDVVLSGINVFGQWRYNTDGIDIVNSHDITVHDCFVHSFDDSITIKGIDRYAFESNRDILIENCVVWCDWGRTLEIGLETECREYYNITFRDCHILRGAAVACDIQNGDRAEVHHITFENISLELESFYTPMELQKSDADAYSKQDVLDISKLLAITNSRFRKAYAFLSDVNTGADLSDEGKPHFASVHHILVKNVQVYCDEAIIAQKGTKAVTVSVKKIVPDSYYGDIVVEDVFLNGKKLDAQDMELFFKDVDPSVLTVR